MKSRVSMTLEDTCQCQFYFDGDVDTVRGWTSGMGFRRRNSILGRSSPRTALWHVCCNLVMLFITSHLAYRYRPPDSHVSSSRASRSVRPGVCSLGQWQVLWKTTLPCEDPPQHPALQINTAGCREIFDFRTAWIEVYRQDYSDADAIRRYVRSDASRRTADMGGELRTPMVADTRSGNPADWSHWTKMCLFRGLKRFETQLSLRKTRPVAGIS